MIQDDTNHFKQRSLRAIVIDQEIIHCIIFMIYQSSKGLSFILNTIFLFYHPALSKLSIAPFTVPRLWLNAKVEFSYTKLSRSSNYLRYVYI